MKKVVFSLFCVWMMQSAFAQQACTPIASYIDSPSVVHPWPYDSVVFPNGGIKKVACVNKPYSFTFTIRIKDSITVNTPFGRTQLPVDSIKLTAGAGVVGLPAGLNYACYPSNCNFRKNSLGCVLISGTPAASNPLGNYSLVITGKAYLILFPSGYDLAIPGTSFPGKYDLKLVATNSTECTAASRDLSGQINSIKNIPNPFTGTTNIQVQAQTGGHYQFWVQNALGQRVHQQVVHLEAGENNFPFHAELLQNGIYFYSLSQGTQMITQKMVVQH